MSSPNSLSTTLQGLSEKISPALRSLIISVGGKVFHLLISEGNKNLATTARQYTQQAGLHVESDEESKQSVAGLRSAGRGIIAGQHSTGIFSDYLPLFAELGDDILRKCVFYTGKYNLAMNQREFPDYTFRAATADTPQDAKVLLENIKHDVEKVNREGGYIFIIPSGADTWVDAEFQSVFRRMIQMSDADLSVLVSQVASEWGRSYTEILKNIMTRTEWSPAENKVVNITSRLTRATDWKGKNGSEMRSFYTSLVGANRGK